MITAAELIGTHGLERHPEGGWFRETWRGPENAQGRAIGTAILFLLEHHQRSHWHRVDAHELWIWQAGDPLELSIAQDKGGPVTSWVLGPDVKAGQGFHGIVDAGLWQSACAALAEPKRGYSLVSCVVTPGFEFAGFELAPAGWEPTA